MEEHKPHEAHKKDESYTVTKTTVWQGICAVLGILLIVSIFTSGFGYGKNDDSDQVIVPSPSQGSNPDQPAPTVKVSVDDDAVIGDKDAPVTIVEFSDFQCPFCARFHQETLPSIMKDYVDTGKVKIVYRDFPLSFHPGAQPAAEAAECVRDQTDDATYYKFHDALFSEQSWTNNPTADTFVSIASKVNSKIDSAELKKCITDRKFQKEVEADFAAGSSYGVSGTPSFFINGVQLVGAQPYSAFKSAIDAQLS